MAGKPLVLVTARERAVRLLVAAALKPAGFRVAEVGRSVPSAEELTDLRPDVVILEAEEPRGQTAEHVRRLLADGSVSLLLMSPLATPTRVAEMLDIGADDYIARPFDPRELAARVRSLVRRHGDRLHVGRRRVGTVMVDLDARAILRDGHSVSLTRPEWKILALLLHNEGRILLREELLTAAFGEAARDDQAALRLAISRLRRKLSLPPWDEGPIRTIHGLGYAFDPGSRLPLAWSGRRGLTEPVAAVESASMPASASVAAVD